jgi:hypothetical protein
MIKQFTNMLSRVWAAIVLFAFIAQAALAATTAPVLATDHGAYLTNEPIKVAFTNRLATAKDWIAIYPDTTAPSPDNDALVWNYLNGSHTSGTTVNQGEFTFPPSLPAGTYYAYLLENDGYRALAKQKFVVAEPTAPFIRLDKRVYAKGEKITVTFTNGPGNALDWIGIYPEGVTPAPSSTIYRYVDNTTTGTTALTSGTVTFDNGLPIPGKWVAYFLENDSYNALAQEAFTIVVTSGAVAIQPDHDHYLPQQPVKISFDGGPGNPLDWIGVYKLGQRPGGPGSTDYRYVDNTKSGSVGFTTGTLTFPNGFNGPQQWAAYFMLNDGYDIRGNANFEVIDAAAPIVQSQKRIYDVGETIAIDFNNAPGNAKDWIAIYKSGETPGVPDSTLWKYTDGTTTGTAGTVLGTINFTGGLTDPGDYTVYLLENDGYNVLSSENFTVRSSALLPARLLSISPEAGKTNALALPDFKALIENRDTTVVQSSIVVKLDNQVIPSQISVDGTRLTVTASASQILAQGSQHSFSITFNDNANNTVSVANFFTVGEIRNVTLPAPLFLETFDTTPEGAIPAGWCVTNYSSPTTIAADLHHLGSLAYENFTVVSASRLAGSFLTYFDNTPENAPIAQITGPSSASYIVNGSFLPAFIRTNALVAISGYHGGNSQILEAYTPTYNLSGKSDIYISFHSLLEQNQDSVAGIEVTTDGGANWSPVIYYLDPLDIITNSDHVIDVDLTYNTFRSDIALYPDLSGGYYGAFLKAPLNPITTADATQPRRDDAPEDGTRVEVLRVSAADNQSTVQFRLFYAGTDSWYFGVDDFGIYSITAAPTITVTRNGNTATLTWPNIAGFVLQSSPTMAPGSWSNVTAVTGNTYNATPTAPITFYRLFKP